MAKQTINIGTSPNKGDGDPIRTAFNKINQNFDELYARDTNTDAQTLSLVGDVLSITGGNSVNLSQYANTGGSGTIDRSWTDPQGNIFNTVDWDSGTVINVQATPFETRTVTTYDSRTNSNSIYFVWDQAFIDEVWDGIGNPQGEGQRYQISFDNGITWLAVETSGYNGQTFFYFDIPFVFQGQYTFTYTIGTPVLIRFNRGSLYTAWFDLANSPVNINDVVGVTLDVFVKSSVDLGNTVEEATTVFTSVKFTNAPFNDNTSEGRIDAPSKYYSGNQEVNNSINLFRKFATVPADANRIYGNLDNGYTGTLRIYWNAKIHTLIPALG